MQVFIAWKEEFFWSLTVAPNTKAVCGKGLPWRLLRGGTVGTIPPGLFKVSHRHKLSTEEAALKLSYGCTRLAVGVVASQAQSCPPKHTGPLGQVMHPSAKLLRNIRSTLRRVPCQKGQVHPSGFCFWGRAQQSPSQFPPSRGLGARTAATSSELPYAPTQSLSNNRTLSLQSILLNSLSRHWPPIPQCCQAASATPRKTALLISSTVAIARWNPSKEFA